MIAKMTPYEARDYAPLWGSDRSASDMAMYNLNNDGRPDDIEQRDLMLENIRDVCLPSLKSGSTRARPMPASLRMWRSWKASPRTLKA